METRDIAMDLLQLLPCPVIIDDAKGKILFTNAAFEEMFKVSGKQLEFFGFEDFTAPEHRNALLNQHLGRMAGKEVPSTVNFTGIRTDGSRIFLQAAVSMLEMREETYFLTVLRDLTATTARSESERIFSGLDSSVRVCGNLVSFLESRLKKGSEQSLDDYLRICSELRNTLNSDYSSEPITPGETDPGLLILETAADIQSMAGPGVKVTCSVAPGLPVLILKREYLRRLLMNIALNSMESLDRDGRIYLRARVHDNTEASAAHGNMQSFPSQVCMEVEDNGCGMSKEVQERAFEPFFTTRDVKLHRGLGLFKVYRGIRYLGGSVHISSKEGKGTTIRILIPISQPAGTN